MAPALEGYLESEEVGAENPDAHAPNFVSGLVPNGVRHVVLHQSDGKVLVIPVRDNIYMATVLGHVPLVTIATANGTIHAGNG